MKKRILFIIMLANVQVLILFFISCVTTPQHNGTSSITSGGTGSGNPSSSVSIATVDALDVTIREASDYLNQNIPRGNKIVILNIESSSPDLSDYIIDELIANAVNDRFFSVVDRQQLDAIRAEQNFQLSGEVDDNEALAIGRFLGAQTIVSDAVNRLGAGYRIRIRALEVQTARVQGQFNRNIATSPIINSLMSIGGSIPQTTSPSGVSAPITSKRYEVVNRSLSWTDAKLETERRGGYLAVITSSEEQRTIENLIARDGNMDCYFLGGYRDISNRFVWITNEPMNYTNWAPGEPNNDSGSGIQDKITIRRIPWQDATGVRLGHWDDDNSNRVVDRGYIIEWD